jgi:cell wall-associated NlpC family hydrolase
MPARARRRIIAAERARPYPYRPSILKSQTSDASGVNGGAQSEGGLSSIAARYFYHFLILALLLAVTVSTSPLHWKPKVLRSLPLVEPFELVTSTSTSSQETLIKPAAPTTDLVNRPRGGLITHRVLYGESLSIIAERYNVSVPTIMWANSLTSDIIRPDQALVVLPVSGVLHVVEGTDTIESLAEMYGSEPSAIVSFNQLTDPSRLQVGDKLVIPGGRPQVVYVAAETPADTPAAAQPAGASQPAAPVAAARPAPAPRAPEPWTYIVKSGDTLGSIASRFGIDIRTIVWANELGSSEVIKPDQELTILPISGVLYTVQEGDALREVASRYGITTASILKANNMADPSMIHAGVDIILPGAQPMRYTQAVAAAAAPAASAAGPAARVGRAAVAEVAAPAPIPVSATAGGRIVGVASRFLGTAYVWGGHSPSGFDCSGYSWYVYQQAGINIPMHDLWGQLQAGPRVRAADLQPGDLVFFVNTYQAGLSHVGIYIGGGRFINAIDYGRGVGVSNLGDSYWGPRFFGASRPW